MPIKKEKFIRYKLDEEKEKEKRQIISVSLNNEELNSLKESMKLLRQDQHGKAIKQLMKIGQIVLHEKKTSLIIDTLFINELNSKRRGITEF